MEKFAMVTNRILSKMRQRVEDLIEENGKKRSSANEEEYANGRDRGIIRKTQRQQSESLGKKRSSANEEEYANGRDRGIIRKTQRQQSESLGKKRSSANEEEYAKSRDRVAGSADGGENHPEVNRESLGASAGLVVNSKMPAWGRGGKRSNSRRSNQNAGNTRTERSTCLARLIESYQDTVEQDALNIHLILTLCQYVASNTGAKADEIEILLVQQKEVLCILEGHETLAELQSMYTITQCDMRFAYRQKYHLL
ncbi:hypothetical protein POM88_013705 [Heracleum sosnowskyi]|uniref:Uncharacterized protein n=1 Tax=Heracleum sosnowskyi TaxID=360622 RepID=A0AAD8J0K3_9APIA|nr:hypothetical protein POM88_013705 [Heracleum sosnowskyi]